MSTTEKRLTISFTREQLRELKALQDKFGETPSDIIHRSVALLYYINFLKD
jgi:hypothetical protein